MGSGALLEGFIGESVTLPTPIGPLLLGVVDAAHPGIAEGISRLLVRSIQDAREEAHGHLPSWLVDDIERNYISPHQVRTLWARTGHRFVLMTPSPLAASPSTILATIHVTRRHDTIFTVDRNLINVSAADHPGFKPEGFHHVVNLSVEHELRRAGIGTLMVDGIVRHFRGLFDGLGLWVRADPPWHAGLVGLGFVHDPSMDVFLPETAARTANLPHEEFNRSHACECVVALPNRPDSFAERPRSMAVKKLQYVSFTREFDASTPRRARGLATPCAPAILETALSVREAHATDWGRVVRALPRAVAVPQDVEALAALLSQLSRESGRAAVRGGGYGAAGQTACDDVVLSTASLEGVLDVSPDRVTARAGTTWATLLAHTAPRGLFPRVVPGWLPATLGGTLSTGGFSKGSRENGFVVDQVLSLLVVTGDGRPVRCSRTQAGWLFDAVLAGHGLFGVIAEVTLSLEARPTPSFVRKTVLRLGAADRRARASMADALVESLEAEAGAYHVTAFTSGAGEWAVARAYQDDDPRGEPFARFLAPPRARAASTSGPALVLQLLLPGASLAAFLARALASLSLDAGDAIQIHPVRQLPRTHGLLLARVSGERAYVVGVTRELGLRAPEALRAENDVLCDAAAALGGASTWLGGLPRSFDARSGLEARALARAELAKRTSDPAGVLGALPPHA